MIVVNPCIDELLARRFEGLEILGVEHLAIDPVETPGETVEAVEGWFWVPTAQSRGNLISYLMEPETDDNVIRYDVEVSGFPSSHAGHLCLLRLKEDDYPGTTKINEWPSWGVHTMDPPRWARADDPANETDAEELELEGLE